MRTAEESFMMAPTLLIAIVALVAWAVLVFGGVTTAGVTHLLLAVGTVLLVRWWALRA
jgi:predicted neutral ceramidase superfamily lipid hydrolase